MNEERRNAGLYRPEFEHDNCGIGAVVNIKGKKSHDTVANALKIVENLEHRAGKDAEGKTGDGVGILLQISHRFFKKEFPSETKENTGSPRFSFHSTRSNGHRQKKCLRSSWKRRGLPFWDGGQSR